MTTLHNLPGEGIDQIVFYGYAWSLSLPGLPYGPQACHFYSVAPFLFTPQFKQRKGGGGVYYNIINDYLLPLSGELPKDPPPRQPYGHPPSLFPPHAHSQGVGPAGPADGDKEAAGWLAPSSWQSDGRIGGDAVTAARV